MLLHFKKIDDVGRTYEYTQETNLSQVSLIELFNDIVSEYLGLSVLNRKINCIGDINSDLGVRGNVGWQHTSSYYQKGDYKFRYTFRDYQGSSKSGSIDVCTLDGNFGYIFQVTILYHTVNFVDIIDKILYYIYDYGLGGQSVDLDDEHFQIFSCKYYEDLPARQVIKYFDVDNVMQSRELFLNDLIECSTFNLVSDFMYNIPLLTSITGSRDDLLPLPVFELDYDFGYGSGTYEGYYSNTNCKIKFVKLVSTAVAHNIYVSSDGDLLDIYNPFQCSSVEPFFNVNCTPDGAVDCASGQVLANQLNNLLQYLNDNVFNNIREESEEMDYTIQLNSIAQSLQDIHSDLNANVLIDDTQQTINITQAVVNNSEVLDDKELTVINNLDYSDRISSKPKISGYPDDDLLI